MDYNIQIKTSSSPQHLIEIHEGTVYSNDVPLAELHKIVACRSEWGGEVNRFYMDNDCYEKPDHIKLIYLSYSECKFYSIMAQLSPTTIKNFSNTYDTDATLLIGLAPLGKVAVWIRNCTKSVIVNWLQGEETNVSMHMFFPLNPNITLSEYCNSYNKQNFSIGQIDDRPNRPQLYQFDNYMKQFTYRYLQVFEKWDKDKERWLKYEEGEVAPEFDYIEEALYDGTHDKLHDGGLMKYHQAGKPKKLRVQWYIKKSEYTAYFWFEDERIREVFDKFYGAHPDTKTDFIIRIDAERRKYELALYRYGLKEPQIIPEDVYQLLVFKNKFEDYRSENYNQERGAWIW